MDQAAIAFKPFHDVPLEAPGQAAVVSGVCNGTLGELFQGPVVRDGELHIAIISLPVCRYSWAYYHRGQAFGDADELPSRPKCRRAVEIYLAAHATTLPPGRWSFSSELPWGRGMASSTADIVATIRCLDALFSQRSSATFIQSTLRAIERSDSVFLQSHALYLSGLQEVMMALPFSPVFHVCYIDEERAVNTEAVTPRLLNHYGGHMPAYGRNLDDMLEAFSAGDTVGIARCATQSALLGQGAVPKQGLGAMLDNRERLGADGIVVAHTGSLIGYLFVDRPDAMRLGELSAFFLGLGHQCRYAQAQF